MPSKYINIDPVADIKSVAGFNLFAITDVLLPYNWHKLACVSVIQLRYDTLNDSITDRINFRCCIMHIK